jgi:hypothetical protein
MAATSPRHLPGDRYLNAQNSYNSSENTSHLRALEDLTLKALKEKTEPHDDYRQIASLSRKSRHAMLYAIREELGLSDNISLGKGYFDPFAETELKGKKEYLVPP